MRNFVLRLGERLPEYTIRPAAEADGDLLLALVRGNTFFVTHTQSHPPTRAECLEDLTALPPGTAPEQKSYLLLFRGGDCVGVMDFIVGYPDSGTGYLGLLLLDAACHGQGHGRTITRGILRAAADMGLGRVALGCFSSNTAGLAFWTRMGFTRYGQAVRQVDGLDYTVLRLEHAAGQI